MSKHLEKLAEQLSSEIVGMEINTAIYKLDSFMCPFVIIRQNDNTFVCKSDFRIDRVKIEVDDDKVTKSYIG